MLYFPTGGGIIRADRTQYQFGVASVSNIITTDRWSIVLRDSSLGRFRSDLGSDPSSLQSSGWKHLSFPVRPAVPAPRLHPSVTRVHRCQHRQLRVCAAQMFNRPSLTRHDTSVAFFNTKAFTTLNCSLNCPQYLNTSIEFYLSSFANIMKNILNGHCIE